MREILAEKVQRGMAATLPLPDGPKRVLVVSVWHRLGTTYVVGRDSHSNVATHAVSSYALARIDA